MKACTPRTGGLSYEGAWHEEIASLAELGLHQAGWREISCQGR
jgi:hypothetical protein